MYLYGCLEGQAVSVAWQVWHLLFQIQNISGCIFAITYKLSQCQRSTSFLHKGLGIKKAIYMLTWVKLKRTWRHFRSCQRTAAAAAAVLVKLLNPWQQCQTVHHVSGQIPFHLNCLNKPAPGAKYGSTSLLQPTKSDT